MRTSTDESSIVRTRYSTRNAEAAHEFLRGRYVEHRVVLHRHTEGFRFDLTGRSAGRLGLAHLRHSTGTTVNSEPLDYLIFGVVSEGTFEITAGRDQVQAGRGGALLSPVGTPFCLSWDRFDVHLLTLPLEAVARTAAAQTGIAPGDLRFEALTPVSPSMLRYWRATVGVVNRELAAPDSALAHPLVQASTISMLAAAALTSFPNTAMTAAQLPGPGRVAPAAVRRAVAYIDAHADQPVSVTDIADAGGVSARALQHAFKQHHDTTPLGYLTRVRLERAHRDLQAGDATRGDTVTAIANQWGFTNAGRFATLYRQAYGQRPSHTLRT
jgi:AraC-like DNA-binding protein